MAGPTYVVAWRIEQTVDDVMVYVAATAAYVNSAAGGVLFGVRWTKNNAHDLERHPSFFCADNACNRVYAVLYVCTSTNRETLQKIFSSICTCTIQNQVQRIQII